MRRAIRRFAGLGLMVALLVGDAARSERPALPVPHADGPTPTSPARAVGDRTTWAELPAATQHGILDAMRQARRVEGSDTLAFTNPRQRLQAAVAPDRVSVAGTAGAQVQFLIAALGRPGALTPMTAATAVGTGTARVELPRAAGAVAVTEWWSNDATGLEQGFVVHERPVGDGPLLVRQPFDTALAATLADEGRTVAFADASGERLRYAGLKAWDATGRPLEAHVVLEASALVLTTDDAGAVYPVTIDPRWYQEAYLKASNTHADDQFGYAVAISGDTLVVGAPFGAGAAYVFVRFGQVWEQQAYLNASNAEGSDFFGASVAISGDTIVVGASGEASAATGVNGDQADNNAFEAGAAYVFVRSGATWTQQAYLKASNTGAGDFFGLSVAISGDTVVVGAYGEDSAATGVNGDQTSNTALEAGAAYVFVRNGASWSQQAYLKASNTESLDCFSFSAVTISGDTVVVGARGEDSAATGVNGDQANNDASNAGAAYVFVRSGSTWTQQAYLKALNASPSDQFGSSVAASGDTVVVGARAEDNSATPLFSGAAYVFVRSGTTWTQQAYLKASNAGYYDAFGASVAISGDTVVVGAYWEDSAATGVYADQADDSAHDAGAAYVFGRSGTTWTQQAYVKARNTDADDEFGIAVAVSGDTAVVGAHFEDSAATGVDGNRFDNSASNAGAAYVFRRYELTLTPTTWAAPVEGGTRNVTVSATYTNGAQVPDVFVTWAPVSSQGWWLTASPVSGSGSGTVTLTAAAQTTSAQPRTATVTIAGETVTVTQPGATPTITARPSAWNAASYGDFLDVTVTSSLPDATWSATSNQPWLTLSTASGTGSGIVKLTAAPNPSSVNTRSATVTIGGDTVSVTQGAGPAWFTVTPTSWPGPAAGGNQVVTVTASHTDAAWTASSDQPWLTLSPSGRTGSGNVTLTAAPNPSSVNGRLATATIAGHLITVTQAAGTASFTVSPTTWNVAAAGGAQAVTVTASHTDAAWTASSSQPWLTVSPASGTGGATVTLVAATSSTQAARSATATIGGQSVTVTQAAGTASFSVTPTLWNAPGAGSTAIVMLSASPLDAPWTASSDQPWLTVSPASGTGSAGLTLTVAANPGSASRSATATIAGQTVAVDQAGQVASPPSAPSGLRALVAGRTVTLDWLSPATGTPLTGYLLQAGLAPGRSDIASVALGPNGTQYVVAGVPDGRYFVRVLASNAVGLSGPSNEVEVVVGRAGTPPSPPTGLTATVTGATVQLAWQAAAGGEAPTGYTLEAGTASGQSNIATLSLGPVPSFSTGGVPIGLYYVQVRASNPFGVSGPSNEVVFSVGGAATPPGPPSGLTASVTGSTVALAWQAPASGGPPTTYVLEAGSGPGQANILPGTSTGNTLTTFSAPAVPVGTYYVRVRAMNLAGLSPPSNETTVDVTSADRPATPTTAALLPSSETDTLGPPTSLAGVVTADTVTLSWQAPLAGAPFAQYVLEVRRAEHDAPWKMATLATDPAVVLYGVAPGAYYVRVRTTDGRGLSPTSNEVLVLVR